MFSSLADQRAYLQPRLRRYHPRFQTGGTIYRRFLDKLVTLQTVILDAGCGTGGIIREYKNKAGRIIGVDRDEHTLRQNQSIDQAIVADLRHIPLADGSVDVITAQFVLEHVEEPEAVFKEFSRLLRPGGSFVFLTSNILNPIMAMSRILPFRSHQWLRRRVLHQTDEAYPTFYRANTIQKLQRLASQHGFKSQTIERAGNPEYLAVAKPLAVPAVFLERLINRPGVSWLQMYLVGYFKKTV